MSKRQTDLTVPGLKGLTPPGRAACGFMYHHSAVQKGSMIGAKKKGTEGHTEDFRLESRGNVPKTARAEHTAAGLLVSKHPFGRFQKTAKMLHSFCF